LLPHPATPSRAIESTAIIGLVRMEPPLACCAPEATSPSQPVARGGEHVRTGLVNRARAAR
jgi:hypothetical protein